VMGRWEGEFDPEAADRAAAAAGAA
jgi:hypothetical protein